LKVWWILFEKSYFLRFSCFFLGLISCYANEWPFVWARVSCADSTISRKFEWTVPSLLYFITMKNKPREVEMLQEWIRGAWETAAQWWVRAGHGTLNRKNNEPINSKVNGTVSKQKANVNDRCFANYALFASWKVPPLIELLALISRG